MRFNAKCIIMRVTRTHNPQQYFYLIGGEMLQEVSDAKYLGIQRDSKLDWSKHILIINGEGHSKLGLVHRNLKAASKTSKRHCLH